jgi:hypothetical protein
MQLSISNQISIGILLPLVAATGFTLLSMWLSTRNANRNAQRQNDLSAKMKLAEFRQAWINELRNCLSKVQSPLSPEPIQVPELHRTAAKIRLLMNRKDPNYAKLDTLLVRLLSDTDHQHRVQSVQEMTPLCQEILKKEWEVLKRDLSYNAPVGGDATLDAGTF